MKNKIKKNLIDQGMPENEAEELANDFLEKKAARAMLQKYLDDDPANELHYGIGFGWAMKAYLVDKMPVEKLEYTLTAIKEKGDYFYFRGVFRAIVEIKEIEDKHNNLEILAAILFENSAEAQKIFTNSTVH